MPMKALRILLIGLGALIALGSLAYFGYATMRISQARNWPQAQGQVLASDVTSRVQEGGKNRRRTRVYDAHISYRYLVAGRSYDSNRVWLTEPAVYSTPDAADSFIAAYPPGGTVSVHYNPKDAADSALVIESRIAPILILTGAGILLVLLALFLPAFRRR
jgi:hypothetical protein